MANKKNTMRITYPSSGEDLYSGRDQQDQGRNAQDQTAGYCYGG